MAPGRTDASAAHHRNCYAHGLEHRWVEAVADVRSGRPGPQDPITPRSVGRLLGEVPNRASGRYSPSSPPPRFGGA